MNKSVLKNITKKILKGTGKTNDEGASSPSNDSQPSSKGSEAANDSLPPNSYPNEPPPAYTPPLLEGSSVAASAARPVKSQPPAKADEKYAFLASFDTIVVVDDSGSMQGASWKETENALRAITPICTAYDSDGIDVYFLNHRSGRSDSDDKARDGYYNINSSNAVEEVFRNVVPYGPTPTGTRLHTILKPYVNRLTASKKNMDNVKPVNIIVITDGRPSDDPESIIVHNARKLDNLEAPPHQVGIQFFQVGNEPDARQALQELDDDIADQGIRDMVDSVTWDGVSASRGKVLTADGILKVVLGAVIRRLDRKPSAGSPKKSA